MGRVVVTVTSDLPEVGARVAAAGTHVESEAAVVFTDTAETIALSAVDIIRSVTPEVTGELADSTTEEIQFTGETSAIIEIRQPAESQPGPGGRGGGEEYVRFVVLGRGDVYPVLAKALAGNNGFGPVAHAGPAAPNPYPEEAEPELEQMIDDELLLAGFEINESTVAVMGGV